MSVQGRRKYDSEFKRNAVRLSEEAGRTVPEVAENLGVGSALIYRWRQQERENSELAFPGNGNMALTQEQKQIRELEKQLKRYSNGKRYIKKSHGHFQQDIEMRYQFIQKHRSSFPVKKMCRSFSIFPSGFYRWQKRPYLFSS